MNHQINGKWVIGNWKMHGSSQENLALLGKILANIESHQSERVQVAVCPPFPYIAQCQALLVNSTIKIGAQDVSAHAVGAYTGEVAASMLLDWECKYVIVGHSERRAYHFETNAVVFAKAKAALNANLIPVVCVGETLEQREKQLTQAVIEEQLTPFLALDSQEWGRVMIAYEPVWAIGTGLSATTEQAQTVHAHIRRWLTNHNVPAASIPILYGGSMKPANAKALMAQPDINGGLIGGASLIAEDFLAIIHEASQL